MSQQINVLFLAAEADPFIKIGGLGDVAGSLPRALRNLSAEVTGGVRLDVRLVLPFHPVMRANLESYQPLEPFTLQRAGESLAVTAYETELGGMRVYLIGGGPIDSSSSVYSSNSEKDAEKYVYFSLAALHLFRQLGWKVDVVHVNDWHTALGAYGLLVQHWQEGEARPASLVTVHNLPFLGPDISEVLETYGIPLAQTDLPSWARLQPLPLGLWAADSIVAVSPTYADEILSEEYGSGLHEFLATRRDTLRGILNGLDVESYSPAADPEIASTYTMDTLDERLANKFALTKEFELSTDLNVPLLGVVSRMDQQKGIDLVVKGLRKIGKRLPWQAVILGAGEPALEKNAKKLAKDLSEKVRVSTRYDAKLARRIYAGADIFLMPSRYEPCGLSQMIAMRYGCVPVVRAAGGLHDTVTDEETGFVFLNAQLKEFVAAVRRALKAYADQERWQTLQRNGMAQDFSWEKSAREYYREYQRIITNR